MSNDRASRDRTTRQRRILDYVSEAGFASAAALVELTGVSLMTIHRDLDHLASRGLLRKFHGGVSALPTSAYESSSEFRKSRHAELKGALATAAAGLVEPGMSLMLDDSTTVLALARQLKGVTPLTVITNYREILELYREEPDVQLIGLGGRYSHSHDSFIGDPESTGISAYAVDIVFQSISTMSGPVTYHQERDIVTMKRQMLPLASRRVLMVDSSKLGRTSLYRFAHISEFTDLVVDDGISDEAAEALREHVQVHIALPDAA